MGSPDRPDPLALAIQKLEPGKADATFAGVRACKSTVLIRGGVGFTLIIVMQWVDEALDLPGRILGAPATPFNWSESLLESVAVLSVAAAVLLWIHRALERIRSLEGLLSICMFCKRISSSDGWMPVEDYVGRHSGARFSHGLCLDCLRKHYPELADMEESDLLDRDASTPFSSVSNPDACRIDS